MKKLYILTVIISHFAFISCSNDEKDINSINNLHGTTKYENLYAPSSKKGNSHMPADQKGEFVKFNFETGKITKSEKDWDIAFRYSTILINGGEKYIYDSEPERTGNVSAYIAKSAFNKISKINEENLKQDSQNGFAIKDDVQSGEGIWSYNMKDHYVMAIPGRTIIIKANTGKIFKMKVLSFYKDAPKQPKAGDLSYGYYTFVYKEIK